MQVTEKARALVDAESLPQSPHVTRRLDVVLRQSHRTVRVNDDGRADDAHVGTSIVLLFTPRTVGLENLVIRVGCEREGERLLLGKALEGSHRVGGHTDDGVSRTGQRGQGITKIACLLRAAGGGGLRVEVDDDTTLRRSEQVGQRQGALSGLSGKVGGLAASFQSIHERQSIGATSPGATGPGAPHASARSTQPPVTASAEPRGGNARTPGQMPGASRAPRWGR